MNKQQILSRIVVIAVLITGGFALSALAAAWNDAPANPPQNNTEAPINVGYGGQVKFGNLSLNGYVDASNLLQYGLIVNNSPIKAAGGLIIETRTADPIAPENGRMWLII